MFTLKTKPLNYTKKEILLYLSGNVLSMPKKNYMSKKSFKKIKGQKIPSNILKKEIIRLFKRHTDKRFNAKQIIKKLKIENSKTSVNTALDTLAEEKMLKHIGEGKFRFNGKIKASTKRATLEGIVDMTRTGAAYIVIEGQDDDVHVSQKYINNALHGDKVRIRSWTPSGRRKAEGEVEEVIERATAHFIGTLSKSKRFSFVMPDRENMPVDIIVYPEHLNNATDGDKVVVKITKWHGNGKKSPIGQITSVLGKAGTSDIEMKSILINNGFNLEFPPEVIKEAEKFRDVIDESEVAIRRDMRSVTTFTIDPHDAKDFDDALSIQYLDDGNCEIGVHIADVTHFVRPGTALDKEAFTRSTSVYLVDRVLPMLPENLSNGLCSLRPNEDKYTFSAVFTFDKKDKLVDRWFGKTLTHSDRRFAYEEAQEVIEAGEGDMAEELKVMNRIAKKLRKAKFKNGAINFETEEVKFKLDENAVPIDVYVKVRKETHLLIEDFMLLANKEVAKFVATKEKPEIPFIYRVHDEPNPDKVADFARFAMELGIKMNMDTPEQIAKSYNDLSEMAEDNDTLKMLQPLAIRTMAKAEYTSENIGHYGLAFEFYSHFTSPIRRYSDVLCHRILYKVLASKNYRVNKQELEDKCRHISFQERKAMDSERESIKYKQVEYIEKNVGETFEGIISGIIDRGLFIELKHSKCEGMASFNTLGESFAVAEGRLKATGNRTGKKYKMGDTVSVTITGADLQKRQLDMRLNVEEAEEEEEIIW